MDALRIERAALLHAPPGAAPLAQGAIERKRMDQARLRPNQGETDERGKPQRASIAKDTALRISYDQDIGRIVVQVFDNASATVVRQLPSEEEVAFLTRFRKAVAPLVNTTV